MGAYVNLRRIAEVTYREVRSLGQVVVTSERVELVSKSPKHNGMYFRIGKVYPESHV